MRSYPCLRLSCLAVLCCSVAAAPLKPVLNLAQHHVEYKPVFPKHLPFAGNGTCETAEYDPETKTTRVHCLGPKIPLARGQTKNVMTLLASPYPYGEQVVVINQTAQLVDETLRPVPLSEVYVHHYVSSYHFLLGNGAELRGSFSRPPLPDPYAMIVNGTEVDNMRLRMTNIQLINTDGVSEKHWKPCLECWCKEDSLTGRPEADDDQDDPTHTKSHPSTGKGSFLCCRNCTVDPPANGVEPAPLNYQLQYNVSYRSLVPEEPSKPVDLMGFDASGGHIEYQIDEVKAPGDLHIKAIETTIDHACPQKQPFEIVRCTAHQHFGGACADLINLDTNETICSSCPIFGTEPSVPGQEDGYVVKIADDDLMPPYKINPGTRIRVQSKYDASVPRYGVMGLLSTWVAGLPEPCYAPAVRSSSNAAEAATGYDHAGTGLPLGATPHLYHFGYPLEQLKEQPAASQPSIMVS